MESTLGENVTGRFRCIDGSDVELVLCSSAQGFALVTRDALGQGDVVPCMDEHTHLEIFDIGGLPALAFAPTEMDSIQNRGSVLAASMLVGSSEAARDQATEYAKERQQFGKPIGVFQAIKHKCADMASRCEAATWQTFYAALAVRDGHADATFQASAAKLLSAKAATENGQANILVHGGYGVTAEYDAHLFLKRSHVLDLLIGTHGEHLTRVLHEPTAA